MPQRDERKLLSSLAAGGPEAWVGFLHAYAGVILRIVRLFADSYDDRMDLFLFACDRLRENDMRRLRAFRFRPEAPCRFSTFLSIVIHNIAIDFIRTREGRFRLFRTIGVRDETDRLLFEYHFRDGRTLEESHGLLESRHGIRLDANEVAERATRLGSRLSANQRWKLLARLMARRHTLAIDPVADVAFNLSDGPTAQSAVTLRGGGGDPEGTLRSREAERLFRDALGAIPARQRLALTLRYRDGLGPREAGEVMGVAAAEAERLGREGLAAVREELRRHNIARHDVESAGLTMIWPA